MIQELISLYEEYKEYRKNHKGVIMTIDPTFDGFMYWLKAKEPVRKHDVCNPCEKLHSTEDNWECKCGCHKSTRKSANRLEETGIPQNSRGNMRETSAPQHNAEPESGHSTSSPVSKPARKNASENCPEICRACSGDKNAWHKGTEPYCHFKAPSKHIISPSEPTQKKSASDQVAENLMNQILDNADRSIHPPLLSKPPELTPAWERVMTILRSTLRTYKNADDWSLNYLNNFHEMKKRLEPIIASIEREAEERGRKLGKKDAHDQENRVVIAGVEGKARAEERKRIVDFLTFEEIKENEK